MAPAVLAGLVREQRPECASHSQEYIRTVAIDAGHETVEVKCSCSVGLTLKVPRTPAPKPQKKAEVGDGA